MTTPEGRERLSVVAYDPEWPRLFDTERARIAAALGNLAVQIDHHGSTAVPGLAAKPVIDIQIGVRSLERLDAYRDRLAAIGYTHRPHPDDAWCPFFRRRAPPTVALHAYHVHLVMTGGEPERRTLAFRDYLRDHPDAVAQYERLKRDVIRRYDVGELETVDDYANAKSAFVSSMTDLALSVGYPR